MLENVLNKMNPFSKSKTIKGYDVTQVLSPLVRQSLLLSSTSSLTFGEAAELYRTSAVVATAIDIIADEIESIQPVVMLADGSMTDSHKIVNFLNNPNKFEDYRRFIGQLARNYLIHRNCFVFGVGALNSAPSQIYSVQPQSISISQDSYDNYPAVYNVSNGRGSGVYSRDDKISKERMRYSDGNLKELYHIMGFSSRVAQTRADSPLQAALLEARQQILGKEHNLALISNGGRLSMIVNFKGRMTEDQFRAREKEVKKKFTGANSAGEIAVLSSETTEIIPIQGSNKDMDYSDLDKVAREALYSRYKIPLPIVNPDAQTYNNFDRAILDLYDRAVLPCVNVLFQALTDFLMPRFKLDPNQVKIVYNPEQITALRQRMLEELKLRRELNLETVNELRQFIPDREPLEGGDTFYQPANLIPVGEDLLTDDDPTRFNEE